MAEDIPNIYEDEDFMIKLIREGVSRLGELGELPSGAALSYICNEDYKVDARLIAKAVCKYNSYSVGE